MLLRYFSAVRYLNIVAVISMLVGAAVMLFLGAYHVYKAIHVIFATENPIVNESVVFIVESLDNFILAFILYYFSYSVYFLFLASEDELGAANQMPDWLKVHSLGEMKTTLLQVIVVALSLFWLRTVLIQTNELGWTDLVLPASILAIAGAVRLMKPKNHE